jgi:Bardet-Biedl syndrome 4 protein
LLLLLLLFRLDDFENSCAAYGKAIELGEDYIIHLNYAITLFKNDEPERAKEHFAKYESLFAALDEASDVDEDVTAQANLMRAALRR